MSPVVLVRADASSEIGTGHVMRCVVLAEALGENGFDVIFLTRALAGNIDTLIHQKGFRNVTIEAVDRSSETDEVVQRVREYDAALIVFDHYGIDDQYEQAVKEQTGVKIFSFDDTYTKHYCDMLLNQNIYADPARYDGLVPEHCKLLCGLEYALLRREFKTVQRRERQPVTQENAHILVTMGGADLPNMTLRVLQALDGMEGFRGAVTVVVGASNPHLETIEQFTASASFQCRVIVNADNMSELMMRADMAIAAAGSTTIELMSMQVPTFVVVLAENQKLIAETIQTQGFGVSLGSVDTFNAVDMQTKITDFFTAPIYQKTVSDKLRELSIGKMQKLVKAIRCGVFATYELRYAGIDDMMPIFELSNDKEVRKYSLNTQEIPLSDHRTWFAKRIAMENAPFLAIVFGNILLGQVRMDNKEEGYVYSISLSKEIRGCGFAADIIRKSLRFLPEHSKVVAYIKNENRASLKSFEKCGFMEEPCEQDTSMFRLVRILQ